MSWKCLLRCCGPQIKGKNILGVICARNLTFSTPTHVSPTKSFYSLLLSEQFKSACKPHPVDRSSSSACLGCLCSFSCLHLSHYVSLPLSCPVWLRIFMSYQSRLHRTNNALLLCSGSLLICCSAES